MFIPVIIVGLAVASLIKNNRRKGQMTGERLKIYNAAISGALKDPVALRKLADGYKKEGLPEQADLLVKRAVLLELPDDVKKARKQVWRKAIASKNKPAVLKLAAEYDNQGCTAAAQHLREYASGLPDTIPAPTPEPVSEPTASPEEHSEPPPEAKAAE